MVNKLIKEDTKMFLTGNEVLAYAANSAEADFMYGYPITPQNEIMHTLSPVDQIFKNEQDVNSSASR